ncbi:hypothetical protein CCB80_03275 [Armatimonadetes bacterium Uphvl-Ar1]|nr:hypothetical protein CCB80_03275 [Armatimonadetes bacterium Uphvl-Ar1]
MFLLALCQADTLNHGWFFLRKVAPRQVASIYTQRPLEAQGLPAYLQMGVGTVLVLGGCWVHLAVLMGVRLVLQELMIGL